MLKTALCMSVLLVAANVCYGHGEGLCVDVYDEQGSHNGFHTSNSSDDPNVINNPKYEQPILRRRTRTSQKLVRTAQTNTWGYLERRRL